MKANGHIWRERERERECVCYSGNLVTSPEPDKKYQRRGPSVKTALGDALPRDWTPRHTCMQLASASRGQARQQSNYSRVPFPPGLSGCPKPACAGSRVHVYLLFSLFCLRGSPCVCVLCSLSLLPTSLSLSLLPTPLSLSRCRY